MKTLHCFFLWSLLLCRELFREEYWVSKGKIGIQIWMLLSGSLFIHDDFIAVDLQSNYRQMMMKPEPLSSTVRCSLITL